MVRLVVIAASLILLFTSYANAGQSGDYAGISSGISLAKQTKVTDREGSTAELSFDSGIPVSVFIGRQYKTGLRVDGELFYKNIPSKELQYSGVTNKNDSDVRFIGVMSNVYYNFYHDLEDAPYSPYAGLGIGFADVHMSAGSDDRFTYWHDDNTLVFAYQGILGFNVPLYKNILLDASYRYFGTNEIAVDKVKTNVDNHNIVLGIRYFFR